MVRVVTIDGPSGSGKGTVARLLAAKLGWHVLDSGAMYRAVGLRVLQRNVSVGDVGWWGSIEPVDIVVGGERLWLNGEDVSVLIRDEVVGVMASKVAAIPMVRAALIEQQRACAIEPGLVADGRDMGTLVFPAAQVKIFLTASFDERVKRRYKQLKEKDLDVNLSALAVALRERDERDLGRSVAPLQAAAAALEVESTGLSIQEVLRQVLEYVYVAFPDL